MSNLIENILRWLFCWVDKLLIVIIDWVYKGLLQITSFNIVDMKIVKEFGSRIGLIIGIFMLFSISTQMLNYILSPDKFKDGSKGGKKIFTNVIISLLALASYNIIFSTAYKIQYKIIETQTIPKLIFGVTTKDSFESENKISYYLFSSLLSISSDVDKEGVCSNALNGVSYDCETFLSTRLDNVGTFKYAVETKNAKFLLDSGNITSQTSEGFVLNYLFIFSSVVGVITALMIFNFCLDIAKRSVTLYFYQLIAPLPIIANVIPGKGEDTFKKWYKACLSTYLDLFIRLIAFFFAIYIISIMYDSFGDVISGHKIIGLFIILGALMFAKELPQIIQDITGIKLGGLTLNPLKKIGDGVPAAAGGFFGAGIAGAKGFGANFYSNWKDKGILGGLGSGIAGGASAFGRGLVGTAKGEKFKDTSTKAYANAMKARLDREDRKKYGITRGEIMKNRLQRSAYAQTNAEIEDSEVKAYDEFVSAGESLVSISENEVQKYATKIDLSNFGGAINTSHGSLTTLGELREAMSDSTNYTAQERAQLNQTYEKLKGDVEAKYREYASVNGSQSLNSSAEFGMIAANDVNGATAKVHADNMVDIYSKNESKDAFHDISTSATTAGQSAEQYIFGSTKQVTKNTKYASTKIKSSSQYRHDHAVQDQTNKESKK